MSTFEDVFYLYERNSTYYHNCSKRYTDCLNECYCYLNQTVIPCTIGDPYVSCKLNIKCYIKPGEICPICYDPIITKSTAYITHCGHHFHKKCLFTYLESKQSSISPTKCPMCRRFLGQPNFSQRYRSSYFNVYHKDDNELDKLEDYWINKEYALPSYCSNRYDHYLLTDINCHVCKAYREKGELLYLH